LAGFPSLKTLQYTAALGYHQINVLQSESRNQAMVIRITDAWEGKTASEVAKEVIGKRTFLNWPFLREGKIAAVSDNLFRYDGGGSTPHSPQYLGSWKRKADKIQETYSKRSGVLTGDVKLLLHIRPLKGLKREENRTFVKVYEDADREVEQALQMTVMNVASEDPRSTEKAAPPLQEEFPAGSKVIFLGEEAYGSEAQVQKTDYKSVSVSIVLFPSNRTEVQTLADLIRKHGTEETHYPAPRLAGILGVSGLALAKITSSWLVILSNGDKCNLGLNLKSEAKGLKVLGYSRKNGRNWEFSEQAMQLISEYKAKFPEIFYKLDQRGDNMAAARDFFLEGNADVKAREVQAWLRSKGVRDLEPVPLSKAQMAKATIQEIEKFSDKLHQSRSLETSKEAVVKGIPPQVVLRPSHAMYRLQNQMFSLGDRVTMVSDSGNIPLCAKGVVVGAGPRTIDVVWDMTFMSGTTLGGRCSENRGLTVSIHSCLNLTRCQFVQNY